ncbi:MAG: hypothetical protein R6V49_11520 [Bacteroidales bacterium]
MKSIFTIPLLLALILIFSCQKDDEKKPKPNYPFKADTTTVEVDAELFMNITYMPRSMAYDTADNSLYFYAPYGTNETGFQILKYNLTTSTLLTVYFYDDQQWANSNGSEGRRLLISGNEFWVPGGATNDKLFLLFIGNNTLQPFGYYDVNMVNYGNKQGDSPYDMVKYQDKLYTLSMNDFVFYGEYSMTVSNAGNFSTGNTVHGSSLAVVTIDSTDYFLVKCGSDNTIELRTITGDFVRSVPLNTGNHSQLVVDSKQRVYVYNSQEQKFFRYSADLLTKEEFYVDYCSESMGFALREDGDHVTIFAGLYPKGLGMVRLPF